MDKEKKGRQYQDTVFRMYFNEEVRLKEVAGALHGRSYEEEPLKIVTLEGTFLSWNIKALKIKICHCAVYTTSANNYGNTFQRRNSIRILRSSSLHQNFMYSTRETTICPKPAR